MNARLSFYIPIASILLLFLIVSSGGSASAQDQTIFGGANDLAPAAAFEHQNEAAPSSNPALDIQEQKIFLYVPMTGGTNGHGVAGYFRGQRTKLGESLAFPGTSATVPDQFGAAEIGVYWRYTDEAGDRRALSVGYGASGRRLLDSGFSPVITANLVYEKKASEDSSWLYLLNYANNRAILNHIPLPGFAWLKRNRLRTLVLGLPFSFVGFRQDPIYLTGVLSPFIVSVEGAWRLSGPTMAYTGFSWLPTAYQNLLEGSDDRLIFEKKEWALGLRASVGPKGSVSIGYVWNIDRRIFLGSSLRRRSTTPIEPEDSGGLQFKARMTF